MSDRLEVELKGNVATLTLNRPERRNALDHSLCDELAHAVTDHAGRARVLVLAGAGPHFCAGADLSGVEDDEFVSALQRALTALVSVPVVTMAAVHGAALGAGTQLAVACDLRVAEATARFGIPAARLGLMVDHWTVQRLAQLAGHGPARAMLLAAEEIDGATAHGLGLAQRLGTLADAQAWAEQISRLAPLTVAGHKLALNRLEPTLDDPEVSTAFRRAWASEDLAEGMAARREGRSPRFGGA